MTQNIFEQLFKPQALESIDYMGDGAFAIYKPDFHENVKQILSKAMFKIKEKIATNTKNHPDGIALFDHQTSNPELANLFAKIDIYLQEDGVVDLEKQQYFVDTTILPNLSGLEIIFFEHPNLELEQYPVGYGAYKYDYNLRPDDNSYMKITFQFNLIDPSKDRIEVDIENTEWVNAKNAPKNQ